MLDTAPWVGTGMNHARTIQKSIRSMLCFFSEGEILAAMRLILETEH